MRKLRVINSRPSADNAAGEIVSGAIGARAGVRNGDPSTGPYKTPWKWRAV